MWERSQQACLSTMSAAQRGPHSHSRVDVFFLRHLNSPSERSTTTSALTAAEASEDDYLHLIYTSNLSLFTSCRFSSVCSAATFTTSVRALSLNRWHQRATPMADHRQQPWQGVPGIAPETQKHALRRALAGRSWWVGTRVRTCRGVAKNETPSTSKAAGTK